MRLGELTKTKVYIEADVINYLDRNGEELDITDENPYFDVDVIEVNKSRCVGFIEVKLNMLAKELDPN